MIAVVMLVLWLIWWGGRRLLIRDIGAVLFFVLEEWHLGYFPMDYNSIVIYENDYGGYS
jgi:hypothetical protein